MCRWAIRESANTALRCLSAPPRVPRSQEDKTPNKRTSNPALAPAAEEQRTPRAEHRGGHGRSTLCRTTDSGATGTATGTGGRHRPPPTAGAAVSTAAHAPPNARASARSCLDDFDGPTLDLISAHRGSSRVLCRDKLWRTGRVPAALDGEVGAEQVEAEQQRLIDS